jgi:hypothetical protein
VTASKVEQVSIQLFFLDAFCNYAMELKSFLQVEGSEGI